MLGCSCCLHETVLCQSTVAYAPESANEMFRVSILYSTGYLLHLFAALQTEVTGLNAIISVVYSFLYSMYVSYSMP